jgi:hypothetical protein
MTEVIENAAVGEVKYRDVIEVDGHQVTVETVNFPPYPDCSRWTDADWRKSEMRGDYEYCGFETTVGLPDGRYYGNGPESVAETAEQLHQAAVAHAPDGVRRMLVPDCGVVNPETGKPCFLKADQHPPTGQWTHHMSSAMSGHDSWPVAQ